MLDDITQHIPLNGHWTCQKVMKMKI